MTLRSTSAVKTARDAKELPRQRDAEFHEVEEDELFEAQEVDQESDDEEDVFEFEDEDEAETGEEEAMSSNLIESDQEEDDDDDDDADLEDDHEDGTEPDDPRSVDELAAEISNSHQLFRRSIKHGNSSALSAGEDLIAARDLLGTKSFLRWLAVIIELSPVDAQRYIDLAEGRQTLDELNPEWQREWTVTEALAQLREHRVDDGEEAEPEVEDDNELDGADHCADDADERGARAVGAKRRHPARTARKGTSR